MRSYLSSNIENDFYVNNNPINFVDPLGLMKCDESYIETKYSKEACYVQHCKSEENYPYGDIQGWFKECSEKRYKNGGGCWRHLDKWGWSVSSSKNVPKNWSEEDKRWSEGWCTTCYKPSKTPSCEELCLGKGVACLEECKKAEPKDGGGDGNGGDGTPTTPDGKRGKKKGNGANDKKHKECVRLCNISEETQCSSEKWSYQNMRVSTNVNIFKLCHCTLKEGACDNACAKNNNELNYRQLPSCYDYFPKSIETAHKILDLIQ